MLKFRPRSTGTLTSLQIPQSATLLKQIPQSLSSFPKLISGPVGPAGADSVVPGPVGPAGADSVVPGPVGPAGADSVVPGPVGPAGADSVVPGPSISYLAGLDSVAINTLEFAAETPTVARSIGPIQISDTGIVYISANLTFTAPTTAIRFTICRSTVELGVNSTSVIDVTNVASHQPLETLETLSAYIGSSTGTSMTGSILDKPGAGQFYYSIWVQCVGSETLTYSTELVILSLMQ